MSSNTVVSVTSVADMDPIENGSHELDEEETEPTPPRKGQVDQFQGVDKNDNDTHLVDGNRSPDKSLSPTIVTPAPNSNPPSPPRTDVKRRLIHEFTSVTRGRVYSLDRGRDLLTSLDAEQWHESLTLADLKHETRTPRKKNGSGARASREDDDKNYDDDEERSYGSHSSDGESSYFAKNLPSPRSGRRFSYDAGSISSAPARSGFYNSSASSLNRESDASLSFSDDDSVTDEEEKRRTTASYSVSGQGRAPMLLPPVGKKTSDSSPMYPQRITRAHSVSSLVSSESDIEHAHRRDEGENRRHGTSPTLGSSFSASTSSLESTSSRSSPDDSANADGRDPQVSHYMGPLSHQKVDDVSAEMLGPPMTHEQMAAWMTYESFQPRPIPPPPPPFFNPNPARYAPMAMGTDQSMTTTQMISSSEVERSTSGGEHSRSVGDVSHGTLPLVYSEDEDIDATHSFGQRLAKGIDMAGSSEKMQFAHSTRQESLSDRGGYRRVDGASVIDQGRQVAGSVPVSSSLERGDSELRSDSSSGKEFTVYWQRWLMLMYMSILNLLSDWTCYSVAPIAVLTMEAFGQIDPEQLVVVFLGANAIATACEPIVLSRLGLRRTVILGALLLMVGSMVKSGGLPPLIESNLEKGQGEWRVYLGFFLVGLSQPLYQCTPALLSASWFPEQERTLATGVALNANQLGIGFAFIFGTLLVATSDDIVGYFGVLSIISTLTFIGCLIQFDDAPPTPPSDTARAMRGDLKLNFPDAVDTIWRSVRSLGSGRDVKDAVGNASTGEDDTRTSSSRQGDIQRRRSNQDGARASRRNRRSSRRSRSPRFSSTNQERHIRQSIGGDPTGAGTRRRSSTSSKKKAASTDSGRRAGQPVLATAPAPAPTEEPTRVAIVRAQTDWETSMARAIPPSPMMPGPVETADSANSRDQNQSLFYDDFPDGGESPDSDYPNFPHGAAYSEPHPPMAYQHSPMPYPSWPPGYVNPNFQYPGYGASQGYEQPPSMVYQPPGYPSQGYYYYPPGPHVPYYPPQANPAYYPYHYDGSNGGSFDDGVEPVVTITPHHLDIHIRDDQIILSTRACLSRPGFVHALTSFTVSGIVINTLSTFMDYLVRLNGAGRQYVGIVGGSFQFIIMISSLIIGKLTDRTRAYYSVAIGMLVLGAFALAECGVDLDADRGVDLRWSLIVVALLVGPLQPVSTELGVEVAYPLSENTVLVIQQLFSNLLSALFIPFFKALKDIGTEAAEDVEMYEKPEYTFSFYLLIVIHAAATVFFATFNGRYLRYEREQAKKAREEQANIDHNRGLSSSYPGYGGPAGERYPLVNPVGF